MNDLFKPLLDWGISTGCITAYDVPAYSMQELISIVIKKMNELLAHVDTSEKGVADALKMMNDKLNELLNGGLSVEVIKQLNQWLSDGTLANIINEVVFAELEGRVSKNEADITNINLNIEGLTDQLNRIVNEVNTLLKDNIDTVNQTIKNFENNVVTREDFAPILNQPNVHLFCSTMSKDFWNRRQPLSLMALVDNGSRAVKIKEGILPNRSYTWDADMIFYNGYYHIAVDYKVGFEESFDDKGKGAIDVYRTKDFVNFDRLTIVSTYKNQFAPSLVVSDGKLRCFANIGNETNTFNDKYGNAIHETDVAYFTIEDNFTCDNIPSIKSEFGKQKLDPQVYIFNGLVYCYIKDEYSKNTDIFRSDSITGLFTKVKTIDIGQDVEAPSVCVIDGKYYLYLDIFSGNKGYCYLKGTSPTNFYGDVFYLNEPYVKDSKIGHFGAVKVDNENIGIIDNFLKEKNIDPLAKTSGDYYRANRPRTTVDLKVIAHGNGETHVNESGHTNINVYDMQLCGGCVYVVSGRTSCVLQRVSHEDLNEGDSVYFMLATQEPSSYLIIEERGFYLPSSSYDVGGVRRVALEVSNGIGDTLIKATKFGGQMVFEGRI